MNPTPTAHAAPNAAPTEELGVLAAVTGMLRDKRRALLEGDMSAASLAPMWQPLLQRLDEFAAARSQRTEGRPADAALQAQADALRQEYEALQHSLQLWSDALRLARDKAQQRPREPVYGQAAGASSRGSLGRG